MPWCNSTTSTRRIAAQARALLAAAAAWKVVRRPARKTRCDPPDEAGAEPRRIGDWRDEKDGVVLFLQRIEPGAVHALASHHLLVFFRDDDGARA
jgi:hypothetical protein